MLNFKMFITKWTPVVLSLLRIVIALLFIERGTQKLFGIPVPWEGGTIALFSLYGFAGILEFIGGIILLLGFFTRPVAFILSGEMAFAYFFKHIQLGFWPNINYGEIPIMYCFVCFYLVFAGGGLLSLDHAFRKID